MALSPYSQAGYKIRGLLESFFDVNDSNSLNEVERFTSELLSDLDEKQVQERLPIIYTQEIGGIKNYFLATVEQNVSDSLLKMYREYMLQQKSKDMPLSSISFAKATALFTIVSKLSQDKKYSLGDLIRLVKRVENANV